MFGPCLPRDDPLANCRDHAGILPSTFVHFGIPTNTYPRGGLAWLSSTWCRVPPLSPPLTGTDDGRPHLTVR